MKRSWLKRRFIPFRQSNKKYNNKTCKCFVKTHAPHDSIAEANYCNLLLARKQSGEIKKYSTQHRIDVKVNGIHIANHYVDFIVYNPDDSIEFHEVKGYATPYWGLLKKIVRATEDTPYIVIDARNLQRSSL